MSMERGPDTERLWLLNNAVWAVRARLHVGLFSVNILKNFFEICYYLKETQMNPTISSTFSFLQLPWLEAHSNFYTCCVLCVHRLGYPRGSGQQPRTLQSPRVECASEPRDKGTSLQCSWDIGQESGDANESAQGLWETMKIQISTSPGSPCLLPRQIKMKSPTGEFTRIPGDLPDAKDRLRRAADATLGRSWASG